MSMNPNNRTTVLMLPTSSLSFWGKFVGKFTINFRTQEDVVLGGGKPFSISERLEKPRSIPQSLCNNSNLLVLDVSNNHFNGMIQECLTQSETLVVLNLQHNMFNGNILDKFPVSCALRTLDLNSNLLKGLIPKSLANCTSLEVHNSNLN
ncbi:Receptor-like protein 12, partial [Mucuna pruriens]